MIATWMLYATLVGLLASLAAHALDRAARALRLPTRFIWLAALSATLLAPFVAYAVRRVGLESNRPSDVTVGVGRAATLATTRSQSSVLSRARTAIVAVAARADRPVIAVWAILSLLLLGRLAVATITLWRRRPQWTARQIDGVTVYVTPDLGPAVVALPRSSILVPEWLLALDSAQVSTVLRHEQEHHLAGDARLLVSATLATALLPWNAAIWWQSRRLRLAVEMDCDARVLRADPRVDRYGTLLLAIAQHPRAALRAAATLTESTSDLERRIDAMTSPRPSAPRIGAAVLSVIAVAAIFAACMTPSPDVVTGPQPQPQPQQVAAPASRESVTYGARQRVGADQTLFDFQVEKPATPARGNSAPRYPEQLRAARIQGIVVAKFVVDTTGHADMKTFIVVKSDHDLFTAAVQGAMPQMRWLPAEVGGRQVRQLIQMPFIFSLSKSDADSIAAPATAGMAAGTVAPRVQQNRQLIQSKPLIVIDGVIQNQDVTVSGDTVLATLLPTSPTPMYPAQLRAAHIEGMVTAKFLVRVDGTADASTFEMMKSDHDLFTLAVKKSLPQLKFKPSTIKGMPVALPVTMPFAFNLSK